MINTDIPLSVKSLVLPDLGGDIQRGLAAGQERALRAQQMQTQQMQNDEAKKTIADKKTMEGVLSLNDTSTPEGQAQAIKDLNTMGQGSQALALGGQFSQMSASAAAAKKAAADAAQEVYDSGNKYISNIAAHIRALPPEQREAARQSALKDMEALHLQPHEFSTTPLDDKSLSEYEMIAMKPEDKVKMRWEQSQRDGVASILPHLNEIMTPKNLETGWNPLTGEKGVALSKAIKAIPSNLLEAEGIKQWIMAQKGEPQQTVFNPALAGAMMTRPQMSAESRISGENQRQSSDYEKIKGPALAFKADYANYKKALASGNKDAIKIAQQGMADKYITTSTGKSTGDAQFGNFITGQGVINAMQNLGDKYSNGSMAPEKIFDTMNEITMATADKFRQKVQQTNAMTRRQADKENKSHGFQIDPEALITHPDDMLAQDSTEFAIPKPAGIPKVGETVDHGNGITVTRTK